MFFLFAFLISCCFAFPSNYPKLNSSKIRLPFVNPEFNLKQFFNNAFNSHDEIYGHLNLIERARMAFMLSPFSNVVKIRVGGDRPDTFLKSNDGTLYFSNKEVGKGADGVILEASNLFSGAKVAIKLLNKFISKDRAEMENSIHLVMGTLNGNPGFGTRNFIVMKLLVGRKLESELEDGGSRFPALTLYIQAKQLIKKLHSYEYYHGDTNTGNFIVETHSGVVYLIDFTRSGSIRCLDDKLKDYIKLAKNSLMEINYRPEKDQAKILPVVREDIRNPERNLYQ